MSPAVTDQGACRVSFRSCPPSSQLGLIWQALEQQADRSSLFRSWAWIGPWLDLFGSRAELAEIWRGDCRVGLAILGRRDSRCGRAPTLHLHESGDPATESIMIEYNGVLAAAGQEAEVIAALLAALARGAVAWRTLSLSGVAAASWSEGCRSLGLEERLLRHPQPAPFADLTTADDPLQWVSRNTRQQVQRSIRYFEAGGPLSLTRAAGTAEALLWFDDLERLHTAVWQGRGQAGAFAPAGFGLFHRRLIAEQFEPGRVDLLRLCRGESVLGYLYGLRSPTGLDAYLSGFVYQAEARWRPGLVAHVLAMRRYRAEGVTTYRFLAGAARYKTSLSTGGDQLCWLVVYRRTLLNFPDRLARCVLRLVQRFYVRQRGKDREDSLSAPHRLQGWSGRSYRSDDRGDASSGPSGPGGGSTAVGGGALRP